MRGTGCSGGAFDFFEPLQNLDGYDVVETVARQPWVAHDKVGMLGHLLRRHQPAVHRPDAAAEPRRDHAAVGDRPGADDALPRRHPQHGLRLQLGAGARSTRRSRPAPTAGQPWAYQRIQEGDTTCADNQALHPEAADLIAEGPRQRPLRPRGRRPALADHLRRQDQRPGLHGLPVDRRADRRALPDARQAHDGHRQEVVHVHERNPRRLAVARDLQPPLRLPGDLRRRRQPPTNGTRRRSCQSPLRSIFETSVRDRAA